MGLPTYRILAFLQALTLLALLAMVGCSSSASLPDGAIGNAGTYNYSPSIIQVGSTRQFWWCSSGVNLASKSSDAIYYESMDVTTLRYSQTRFVLTETPGGWDAIYTCNPKVVGGVFENPFGDGQSYGYAMYYVGTASPAGNYNCIGVAFSQDGISWKKYPHPVIVPSSTVGYGVGQPAVYNTDHKSAIFMAYEDWNPIRHIAAVSKDGIHFQVEGTITTIGLDPDDSHTTWGDMAYDAKTAEYYAVFNRPLRPHAATGGVSERGQYGVQLYRIPQSALLTGSTPWRQLTTLDTNATGFESNFIAGFVRDLYGGVDLPFYPALEMYTSISYPPPAWDATPTEAAISAEVQNWILAPMTWSPGKETVTALNRYFNGKVHEVTTGWIDPNANFQLQSMLGHLYSTPVQGADVAFYGCNNSQDYFVSLESDCEAQRILGTQGYGYSRPVPGLNLVPLYRCRTLEDHFVSTDQECEGEVTEQLLGYALP